MTEALRIFAAGSPRPVIDQLAAASLHGLALMYADTRELAARIADGATADLFASASPEQPELLHEQGLVGPPRPFATNRLVDDVAARLLDGSCGAGVLHTTDVAVRSPRLRATELPERARVAVTLVACATAAAADREGASAWVRALTAPRARAVLRPAGFGPPPRDQSA